MIYLYKKVHEKKSYDAIAGSLRPGGVQANRAAVRKKQASGTGGYAGL